MEQNFVPRHVRELKEPNADTAPPEPIAIETLRDSPAWVLLGEPGAGKTTAFQQEAAACGGRYLRIAEFLEMDDVSDWQGKTLFLDALDETRASADGTTLLKVSNKLKKLGKPKFRVSCRAADWYGASDRGDLGGDVQVFALEPLAEQEIEQCLQRLAIPDVQNFMQQARDAGIFELLENPQTLQLLAQAFQSGFPSSRRAVFEQACQQQAHEHNKRQRDRTRDASTQVEQVEDLLDMAGQLCAVMLLSDQDGFALDAAVASKRYASLQQCAPQNLNTAETVLRRPLFIADGEEQVRPSHRSVAEFLAACWLAKQIDGHGLPLKRVLKLLLGFDQKTVAGLRGLYAWLATLCISACQRLIAADVLTVVLYGDVKEMLPDMKKLVWEKLKTDCSVFLSLDQFLQSTALGGLWCDSLHDEFLNVLQNPSRDDEAQSLVNIVLRILATAHELPDGLKSGLQAILPNMAQQADRWQGIRSKAVQVWLDVVNPSDSEALQCLNALAQYGDDEAALVLLVQRLYPHSLTIKQLMSYLRPPDLNFLSGASLVYQLPSIIRDEHIPEALDIWSKRDDLSVHDYQRPFLRHTFEKLLQHGVEQYGDAVSDQRLFNWLLIGVDQYGRNYFKEYKQALQDWLKARPQRCLGLLGICYAQCLGKANDWKEAQQQLARYIGLGIYQRRLGGVLLDIDSSEIDPPVDMTLWHFQQLQKTSDAPVAQLHLRNVMFSLHAKAQQAVSLEMVEAWAAQDSGYQEWLKPYLYWEGLTNPDYYWEGLTNPDYDTQKQAHEWQQQDEAKRHERYQAIQLFLDNLTTPQAHIGVLGHLAHEVWNDLQFEVEVNTDKVQQRFERFFPEQEGRAVYTLAAQAFRLCPQRADVPSVSDIIKRYAEQNKVYNLQLPCLIGMALLWQDGGAAILRGFTDSTLERMVCFALVNNFSRAYSAWFKHLVKQCPDLVAQVFMQYARAAFKTNKVVGDLSQYPELAKLTLHRLLQAVPKRLKTEQLGYFSGWLKTALRQNMPELPDLIAHKLSLRSLDMPQRLYWLLAGTIIDSPRYESQLWNYVSDRWQRVEQVVKFLRTDEDRLEFSAQLGVHSLAKLIEMLAPHADFEIPTGVHWVSESQLLEGLVRRLMDTLSAKASPEAQTELQRLAQLPQLKPVRFNLERGALDLQQRLREQQFSYQSVEQVAQVLNNSKPTCGADLFALTLDCLDDIAQDIKTSNSDLYRQFWSEDKQKNRHKDENSCRDAVLEMLRNKLKPQGVDCQPEGDYVADKRADIRLSVGTNINLPIEIKGEWHRKLWTSINDQLIKQYLPASGYGIYLVLWVGGDEQKLGPEGRASSAEELQQRLTATILQPYCNKVAVLVLDVSWHK